MFFCTFKIKIDGQKSGLGYMKVQSPYPNQDKDAKPHSGTSNILQGPKSGIKGYGYSLHLQNQDSEPKFGIWEYQRPLTLSKSISGFKTPVRSLQSPPKPQIRTSRTLMIFPPPNQERNPKFTRILYQRPVIIFK